MAEPGRVLLITVSVQSQLVFEPGDVDRPDPGVQGQRSGRVLGGVDHPGEEGGGLGGQGLDDQDRVRRERPPHVQPDASRRDVPDRGQLLRDLLRPFRPDPDRAAAQDAGRRPPLDLPTCRGPVRPEGVPARVARTH